MPHLWVRDEFRPTEKRTAVTPDGVAELLAAGFDITVEASEKRVFPTEAYRAAGATITANGTWPEAPAEAIILGLKELPPDGAPLRHRHILFGHAYKGQAGAEAFLSRFANGGGTLFDLEYLTDDAGRRVAAFGYWAGFVGAAVTLLSWALAEQGRTLQPVAPYASPDALIDTLRNALTDETPSVIVIGALGRVGTGASEVARRLGLPLTQWDIAETANGGPFPQILDHDVFLNCILASPGVPVFVPASARNVPRQLRAIGDIACDPTSDYSPIKVYDAVTSWTAPVTRVTDSPRLDVMAIDNLPSLLPRESSEDFAAQLLPYLLELTDSGSGVWARASAVFRDHCPH